MTTSFAAPTPSTPFAAAGDPQGQSTHRWIRLRALTLAAAGLPLATASRRASKEFQERQTHAGKDAVFTDEDDARG